MKLPEIYKNKIDKDIRNNQNTYTGKSNDNSDILNILPVMVEIETKYKKFSAIVIGRTDNYIVTRNKDIIKIEDIVAIKKA